MTAAKIAWFLIALTVCSGFLALGNWQWQRALYKEALEVRLTEAERSAPVNLDVALRRGEQARFSKVVVAGVLQRPSVFLDNRIREGRVGVLVVNRLRIASSEADLLVVRGWQPLADGIRALPSVQVPEQRLEMQGFLDRPPAAGLSLGSAPGASAAADPLLVTRLDLEWLAQRWERPLLPWVLFLDADAPAGYVRDWQPQYLPAARHRGYAVQWWGLAAATLVIYAVLGWRWRKRTMSAPAKA